MSGYDFSNSEVDEWIAQQYDAGQKNERDNLLLLLQRRRDGWLAVEPPTSMTIARADECNQIIDEIEGDPIRPDGFEPKESAYQEAVRYLAEPIEDQIK